MLNRRIVPLNRLYFFLIEHFLGRSRHCNEVTLWSECVNKYFCLFQVSMYAEDHLLDALFLQHLLSQLTGDNLSLYFNDYTDQLLDGESLYTTLKKVFATVGTISGHFATKRLATGRFATETSQLANAFLFAASTLA